MEILNLDQIAVDDKTVVLDGKEYLIPGELPVEIMFKIMKNSQDLEKNPENVDAFEKSFAQLHDVLSIKNEITIEELKMKLSIKQYGKLIAYIFNSDEEEVEKKPEGDQGDL